VARYRNDVTGAVRISSTYLGRGWTLIREPKVVEAPVPVVEIEPKPRRRSPEPDAEKETSG
jgi:hypothetical protein